MNPVHPGAEQRECATCQWWEEGKCHRHPPQMVLYPLGNQHPITYTPTSYWPYVLATDWCGEWTPA